MSVEIDLKKGDLKKIQKNMDKVGRDSSSKSVMNAALLRVKNNIILRTNSGIGVNNKQFQGYSSSYASEEGKTIVNLTKTGTMMNAMTQKTLSDTSGLIFFINSGYKDSKITVHDLVKIHNTGDGVPEREFFGVNNKDNKDVLKTYQNSVTKAIRRQK